MDFFLRCASLLSKSPCVLFIKYMGLGIQKLFFCSLGCAWFSVYVRAIEPFWAFSLSSCPKTPPPRDARHLAIAVSSVIYKYEMLEDLSYSSSTNMPPQPFLLVAPATRGLSLALTRHLLCSTEYPVFATHRSGSAEEVTRHILQPIGHVNPARLHLLGLDLASECSIALAAGRLADSLQKMHVGGSYLHTAFFSGGILHPEKRPSDIDLENITYTFQINTISHLLCIKHFSQFLPHTNFQGELPGPSKWVHISARLGSIGDNTRGGWYSYRSSKAALNQIIKTFDLHLEMNKTQAICVGIHPGTVKTGLTRNYWHSAAHNGLFEPAVAAEKVFNLVDNLTMEHRGKVWDWAGKEVPW